MIGIGISIPMMMPFAEDATAFVRSGVLRSPLAITRAQTGGVQSTALNGGNNGLTFYGADVPRFTGPAQRLLIEGQTTNFINGMAAPVTQNVTVAAVAHTLSFYGTGSITLSGVATGTLSGTGANDRVALTFTPTPGTLTLTVSGTVTRAQIEARGFATSYVEVSSGAATRGVDLISATLADLGVTSGITMLWSGLIYQAPATAGEQTIFQVSDGTANNRYRLISESGSGNILLLRATAGVGGPNIITPESPRPTNSIFKIGLSINISTGTAISSLNGRAVGTITGGPTSGLTLFNLGSANGSAPMFGETTSIRILPNSVSGADLQSLTGAMP